MKGKVAVHSSFEGKEHLLCEESNMVVDSAGESFVDVLVTPPSLNVSSIGDTDVTVSSIFDTSNYNIGLISFGKSKIGYQNNMHKYKKHNLIASSTSFDGLTYVGSTHTDVLSPHSVDGSSVVTRLSSSIDDGGYVEWSVDNGRIGEDIRFLNMSSKILTIDIKPDLNNMMAPATHVPESDEESRAYITIEIEQDDSLNTNDYTKKFTLGFSNPLNQEFGDLKGILNYIEDPENVVLTHKSMGNGWYRIGCVIPQPTGPSSDAGAGSNYSIRIYPCSNNEVIPGFIKVGSILIARMSFNVGSVPITYHLPNEGVYSTATDLLEYPTLSKSVAQDRQIHYVLNQPGTLTNYDEGFNVSAGLCESPKPVDTVLQPETKPSYENYTALSLPEGQNLNFYPYVGDTFLSTKDYLEPGWSWTTAFEQMPLQYDFSWLGGFAPGNTRLSQVRLYDDNSDGGAANPGKITNLATTKFINIDGYRLMDERGYLRVFTANETKPGAGDVGIAKVVSTAAQAQSGVVEYKIVIPNADRAAANCFGGIFEIGLHALDNGKIREVNKLKITDSIIKYFNSKQELYGKLFCKKSFNFDITNNKVFESSHDVNILWTLDFCNN